MAAQMESAWHVHKGGRGSSTEADWPLTDSHGNAPTDVVTPESVQAQRSSAENPLEAHRPESTSRKPLPYSYNVPRRKESLPQNRIQNKAGGDHENFEQRRSMEQRSSMQPQGQPAQSSFEGLSHPIDQSGGNNLGREIDQELAHMSISGKGQEYANGQTSRTQAVGGHNNGTHQTSEHLRLPAGFDVGQSVQTHIDTEWRPAVVHENIHHKKTEVIQEAITRDIHVHHYYTYVQPIKVVEVLPARHFRIDEKTGAKVEITAPPGWRMPKDLEPRLADTSGLSGWSRHYLVNEQYPNGTPEPAPKNLTWQ